MPLCTCIQSEFINMKTIFSPLHEKHWLKFELSAGQLKPCFEKPSRAEMVLTEIKGRKLGEIIEPKNYPEAHLERVHSPDYIEFLKSCWAQWEKEIGPENDAMASVFSRPDQKHRISNNIEGKLGFYSGDLTAGLGKDSWIAIKSSADTALHGAELVLAGERAVFSLCRPAGHHASKAIMAGYCYVNNAAVATQFLLDEGKSKVAILDIDYHHGNGTQSMFYDRDDVLFTSIHGDPHEEYPFYLGHQDEKGEGKGLGYNINYPLPLDTTAWPEYLTALLSSFEDIKKYAPEVLVISLGVDTYENDPISHFKLKSADFLEIGRLLESLGLPTLFIFEGGYAVRELGINTVNVLEAFESAMHDS